MIVLKENRKKTFVILFLFQLVPVRVLYVIERVSGVAEALIGSFILSEYTV